MAPGSSITPFLVALAALTSASCEREPTDEESVNVVRAHIMQGPVAACCDLRPVRTPNCAGDAPTHCHCMNQARIVSSKVTAPISQERMVRAVQVQVEGPSGKGSCDYMVYRGAIHEGFCGCAR